MLAALIVLASATTLHTNTETVSAVAERDGALWVTTTGGLERYDLATLARTSVEPVPQPPAAALAVAPRYQGARETVRVSTSIGTVVGTAGNGVWLDGAAPRRLTPDGQICGNHVVAVTTWKQATWVATFDAGVCWLEGDRWVKPATPFRMANDLAVTRLGLVVAASEGLFVSTDGAAFARWEGIADTGFNDLAVDGDTLYATMPGALWQLPLHRRAGRARTRWKPGGSKALQAVVAERGAVLVTSEDRGLLAMQRRGTDVEVHDRAAGLATSWHIDVALDAGAAHVATLRHGLLRRDPTGTWTRLLPDAWLLFAGTDPRGGVWVGAQGGVYHVDRAGTVTDHTSLLPAHLDRNVHVIAAHRRALWIGTEGGLVRVAR